MFFFYFAPQECCWSLFFLLLSALNLKHRVQTSYTSHSSSEEAKYHIGLIIFLAKTKRCNIKNVTCMCTSGQYMCDKDLNDEEQVTHKVETSSVQRASLSQRKECKSDLSTTRHFNMSKLILSLMHSKCESGMNVCESLKSL